MSENTPFEVFLSVPPGLEPVLQDEAEALGFPNPTVTPGGVLFKGNWADVQRANLMLRGATRVLARIGSFRAMHLAQLDKRARKFDWSLFRADVPLKVEATCKRSRIYHAGAARQRIEGALTANGLNVSGDATMTLRVRIEDDLCTISVDTSGEPLHKRGFKEAVGKAPIRETLAANFLRMCGYDGTEPVVDPMCGSGTFLIEAADWASGNAPGRARRFAYEELNTRLSAPVLPQPSTPQAQFLGYDRDQGAIQNAMRNAKAAEVMATFTCQPVSAFSPPCDTPGLVITNPPYGARIGNRKLLFALYGTLGERLSTQFSGWRVGIVTSDKGLAKATGLSFDSISAPIPHGGLKIFLFQARIP